MMRATFGLSGDRCGADADDRRDADHEQQGPEQPGGRRQIPTVEEFKAAVERERLAAIGLTPCG
jgi:hypothetical protein